MAQGPGSAEPAGEHGPGHEHDPHGFAAVAEAVGRGERARRLRRGLLVAVFTLALLTLAAELALRLTHEREHALEHDVTRTNRRWVALTRAHVFEEITDPVRRYAMRPGADDVIDGWRFRVSPQRTRAEFCTAT